MGDVLPLLVLLLLFAGGGTPPPAPKPKPKEPGDVGPDERCPDGAPVEYDGPKLYGDVRASDKAAGLTPAEQVFLADVLAELSGGANNDATGLVLGGAGGLCTKDLIREAMQLPEDATWDVIIAAVIFGITSDKGIIKWPLLSQPQRERIGLLTLAVLRHHNPPKPDDLVELEDEASDPAPPILSEKPTRGRWYRVKYGDVPLTMAGAASGYGAGTVARREYAKKVQTHPSNNNSMTLAAPNSFDAKYLGGLRMVLLTSYDCAALGAKRGSGECYPAIFFPE